MSGRARAGQTVQEVSFALPSLVSIEYLHRRYAGTEERFDTLFTHCQIVAAIAEERIEQNSNLGVVPSLVYAGALLHDIGWYQLGSGSAYIQHGLLGYKLLQAEGYPEVLCRFAACHSGVGISRQDIAREGLALPPDDYEPATINEKLVAYADKFHSKYPSLHFNSIDSIRSDLSQYGEDKVARFDQWRALFGEPDIRHLAKRYKQKIG